MANYLMTSAEQAKLEAIETGAEVNVIEVVKQNGSALSITDKSVNVVADANVIEGIKLSDSGSVLTPTEKIVTIPNATTSADGLMSSEDKAKLAGLPETEKKFDGTTLINSTGPQATDLSFALLGSHYYFYMMASLSSFSNLAGGFKIRFAFTGDIYATYLSILTYYTETSGGVFASGNVVGVVDTTNDWLDFIVAEDFSGFAKVYFKIESYISTGSGAQTMTTQAGVVTLGQSFTLSGAFGKMQKVS
jgi:hypothetical protein